MSGSRDVNAGKDPSGDSTPRDEAGQKPGAGALQDQQVRLRDESVAGGELRDDAYRLSYDTIKQLSSHHRDHRNRNPELFRKWISDLKSTLSKRGQAITNTPSFEKLKGVYHSTTAHSRSMSHMDNTRYDHCIHAAHTARVLGHRLGLTPYEVNVIELVMLQHDTHRLGSHALDRVFSSMPGAPKIDEWWAKGDYHEYHGALIVAADSDLRRILDKYLPDVLAILSFDDKRSLAERNRDYGPVQPRLSPERIKALYHLKDELDRCSYLKLDYIRSGFKPELIAQVVRDVERHELTLSSHGDELRINIDGTGGDRPFDDVARWRHFYRANIATLPIGCLAEKVIFHDGVWDRAVKKFGQRDLESAKLYRFVRDEALAGRYENILSDEALAFLKAAETGDGLSVEDVYAPLVTLTFADFSETRGRKALEGCVPSGLASELCGVPRTDMTVLEAELRNALKLAGIDTKVHLLITNDFGKTLKYTVSEGGGQPEERLVFTDCPPQLLRVIVAGRAINQEGEGLDLRSTKLVVDDFLRRGGYLKDASGLSNPNLNVFCESNDDTFFSPGPASRMASVVPEWLRLEVPVR